MLQAVRPRQGRGRGLRPLAEDRFPNDKAALFDKAVATDRLGRKDEAIGLYGQVLAIDHNDVDASKGISVALFSLERYEEALARAVQGAIHDPDQLVFWRIQGDSLFMLKRFEEAVKAYDRAIVLSPQEQEARSTRRGCAWRACAASRRPSSATIRPWPWTSRTRTCGSARASPWNGWSGTRRRWACYDHALSLDKEGRFVHARRGQVLAKLSRHDEAVVSFDKALEMGPKDIEVLTAKKNSLKSMGRYEDIIKVCDRIVKIRAEEQAGLGGPGNGPLPSRATSWRPCVLTTARWRSSRGT